MGTFIGHVIAGVMFIILSSVWMLVNWSRFHQSRCGRRRKFIKTNPRLRSQTICTFLCWKEISFDGVFKMVAAILGVLSEAIPVVYYELPWIAHSFHHIAMYSFLGLSGAVDLAVSAGVTLPQGTDYAALAFFFVIEGLLFYYHVFGRPPLDVHVHMLLVIAIAAIVFAILAEMKFKHETLPGLLRSMAAMVQGTWFVQIAFILFNPIPGYIPYNQYDMEAIMMVTVFFCAHICGAVILAILSGLLMHFWYNFKSTPGENISYAPVPTSIQGSQESLNNKMIANGGRNVLLEKEEESTDA